MTQFSNKLKTFTARELQRQFTSLDNSVGFFISNTITTPNGINSIEEESKTRRQIQTVKILDDDRVALMINRVNWTSGTIYQPYSYDADNSSRNFYVFTSENNVYACISAGGGRKSIEEPRGVGTDPIYLSNGYIWKFLYKVPEGLIDFIDDNYIPILEIPFYEGNPTPYSTDLDKQLQYNVQYNAAGGKIESISIDTIGSEYPYSIKGSSNHFVRTVTGTSIQLSTSASSSDDVYNEYTLRIISGPGIGQFKKITDYIGSTKTATIESEFDTALTTESKYEIIPTITILGDGTGAKAYSKLQSYDSKTINSIVITNNGSDYSYASATVSPAASPTATVLHVNVNPVEGLGRNPIFDLNVKRVSILATIERDEADRAVIGNDYRQYGLWLSPKINATYLNAGKVVGTVAYKQTKIDVTSNGTTFSNNYFLENDFVFGTQSYNMGRVVSFDKNGTSSGQITLNGLNSPFINGEELYAFKTINTDGTFSGGFTFTNKTAKVSNTLFEDSVRPESLDRYRCSHKLSIVRNDGNSFDNTEPYRDISIDSGATGASGSVGNVLYFDNIQGSRGDLYLTNVFPSSSSYSLGFTGGETLSVNNGTTTIELTIESFSPPELDLFSGQLLYISSIDPVTRSAEQADIFKINLDF